MNELLDRFLSSLLWLQKVFTILGLNLKNTRKGALWSATCFLIVSQAGLYICLQRIIPILYVSVKDVTFFLQVVDRLGRFIGNASVHLGLFIRTGRTLRTLCEMLEPIDQAVGRPQLKKLSKSSIAYFTWLIFQVLP